MRKLNGGEIRLLQETSSAHAWDENRTKTIDFQGEGEIYLRVNEPVFFINENKYCARDNLCTAAGES